MIFKSSKKSIKSMRGYLPWYKRVMVDLKVLDVYEDDSKYYSRVNRMNPLTYVCVLVALLVIGFGYLHMGFRKVGNYLKRIGIKVFNFLFND